MKRTVVAIASLSAVVVAGLAVARGDGARPTAGDRQKHGSPIDHFMSFDQDDDGKLSRSEVEAAFGALNLGSRQPHHRHHARDHRSPNHRGLSRDHSHPDHRTLPHGHPQHSAQHHHYHAYPPPPPQHLVHHQPGPPRRPAPPEPGTILPKPVVKALDLSDDQKSQLAELQSHVETKLKEILTTAQQHQLQPGHALRPQHDRLRNVGGPPHGPPRHGPPHRRNDCEPEKVEPEKSDQDVSTEA